MKFPFTICLLAILAIPLPARAVYLRLAADAAGSSCQIADPGPGGVVSVYVLLREASGVTGVSFSAPVPESAGLVHAGDTSAFTPVGTSQSGAAVGFGACVTGSITVMEMAFVRVGTGAPCVEYYLAPHPQYGYAEYTGCDFFILPIALVDGVTLNATAECSGYIPIGNPTPQDGQTGVPLSTELSWTSAHYVCNAPLLTVTEGHVYFGTTSDPPYFAFVSSPHTVGPLSPGTTYYWRIQNEYPYVSSDVWTFTTTSSVATRQSTWGAIKALYR